MSSSVPRQSIFPTMGVNLQKDPTSIRDDECVRALNLFPSQPGGPLELRPALSAVRELFWNNPAAPPARDSQHWWHERLGGGFVIYSKDVKDAREAIKFFNADLTSTGAAFNVFPVAEAVTPPCMVRVNQQVFVMNGAGMWVVDETQLVPGLGSGGDVPLVRASTAGITPAFATNVRSRMWYANLGAGKGNRIIVSDRFLPEQLPTEALFSFEVGNADEGPITAIVEAAVTDGGSAETNVVLVWKRNNLYVIAGEPAQSTDTGSTPDWRLGTLRIVRPQTQAGCVSNRTVAVTPGGVFWLGPDDVWFMPFGGSAVAVGTKIRPAISQVDASREQWMYGLYVDGVYRVSADAAGQATMNSFIPDHIAAPAEEWWLDCRTPESDDDRGYPTNAGEARWWGPQKYEGISPPSGVGIPEAAIPVYHRAVMQEDGTVLQESTSSSDWETQSGAYFVELVTLLQVAKGPAYDAVLPVRFSQPWKPAYAYEVGDEVVPTVADLGTHLQTDGDAVIDYFRVWVVTAVAVPGGVSGGTHPFGAGVPGPTVLDGDISWYVRNSAIGTHRGSSYAPLGLCPAIEPELITKEYDFGDDVVNKLVQGIEVVHANEALITVGVNSIIDSQLFSQVMTLPETTVVPVVSGGGGIIPLQGQRRFQLDYLPLDNGGVRRLVGRTAQFRLQWYEAGVVIDDTNDRFELIVNGNTYLIVVTKGSYNSMDAVIFAIRSAIIALVANTDISLQEFGFVKFENNSGFVMTLPPAVSDVHAKLLDRLGFDPTRTHISFAAATSWLIGKYAVRQAALPIVSLKSLNVRIRPFTRRAR